MRDTSINGVRLVVKITKKCHEMMEIMAMRMTKRTMTQRSRNDEWGKKYEKDAEA